MVARACRRPGHQPLRPQDRSSAPENGLLNVPAGRQCLLRKFVTLMIATGTAVGLSACATQTNAESSPDFDRSSQTGVPQSAPTPDNPTSDVRGDDSLPTTPETNPTPINTNSTMAPEEKEPLPWPVPGGVADCSSGLYLFHFDYQTRSGKIVQGNQVVAHCEDEVYGRHKQGNLWIDNRERYLSPDAHIPVLIVLSGMDGAASRCERQYGPICDETFFIQQP